MGFLSVRLPLQTPTPTPWSCVLTLGWGLGSLGDGNTCGISDWPGPSR